MKKLKIHLLHYIMDMVYKTMSFFFRPEKRMLVFIPHGGALENGYDVFNYKSDNALALARYIIGQYGNMYKYRIACHICQYDDLHDKMRKKFPNLDIDCFPYMGAKSLYMQVRLILPIMRGEYVFTSEGENFSFKHKKQKAYFLNYYIPFKNDYGVSCHPLWDKYEKFYDGAFSTSLLASNIVANVYAMSLGKFHTFGFSRNDELLKPYNCNALDRFIENSVSYRVDKVVLYVPTHRDYETTKANERDILGFPVQQQILGEILKENATVIICKLHSKQNRNAINGMLPEGILLYEANPDFGLCELMQRADYMITDYTSTVLDYILLNRPILFNFYDFEKYKSTRGFSYDPIDFLLAGELFTNASTFYNALRDMLKGKDEHGERRKFLCELFHKYIDTNSSKRICEYVFHN